MSKTYVRVDRQGTKYLQVLLWESPLMKDKTCLDIAQEAQCKKFVAHPHVQQLLTEVSNIIRRFLAG